MALLGALARQTPLAVGCFCADERRCHRSVLWAAIEQLIAALNEGRSEALEQYLAAIGRFHRYSLRNLMLIASHKPAARYVAGFHTWQKLGRFVKKGKKGILILAPILQRKTALNQL